MKSLLEYLEDFRFITISKDHHELLNSYYAVLKNNNLLGKQEKNKLYNIIIQQIMGGYEIKNNLVKDVLRNNTSA